MSVLHGQTAESCGWRVLSLSLVILAVFGIITWQAIHFNTPPDAPAFVAHWREISQRGELEIGDTAPEFHLLTPDGKQEVTLSELRGNEPVVLYFGSYTCPYFRAHAGPMAQINARFKDQAQFFLVYIREAHPEEDGLIPENGNLEPIPAAKSFEDRARAAASCAADLNIAMPVLVDDIDNSTASDYRAWPERVYVLDSKGKIVYTGLGAGNIDISNIETSLQSLL